MLYSPKHTMSSSSPWRVHNSRHGNRHSSSSYRLAGDKHYKWHTMEMVTHLGHTTLFLVWLVWSWGKPQTDSALWPSCCYYNLSKRKLSSVEGSVITFISGSVSIWRPSKSMGTRPSLSISSEGSRSVSNEPDIAEPKSFTNSCRERSSPVLEEKSVITKQSDVTLRMQKESHIYILHITKESKTRSCVKNLWCLLQFKCFYTCDKVSKKCKLITTQCPLKKFLIKLN